jgi:hypothetical protein
VTIYRVAPGRLLAVADTISGGKSANTYWTTTDGVAWSAETGPRLTGAFRNVFSYGDRALLISWGSTWDSGDDSLPPMVVAEKSDGTLAVLAQAGTAPAVLPDLGGGVGYVPVPNVALGPAGLLVSDGRSIWIGVPG